MLLGRQGAMNEVTDGGEDWKSPMIWREGAGVMGGFGCLPSLSGQRDPGFSVDTTVGCQEPQPPKLPCVSYRE